MSLRVLLAKKDIKMTDTSQQVRVSGKTRVYGKTWMWRWRNTAQHWQIKVFEMEAIWILLQHFQEPLSWVTHTHMDQQHLGVFFVLFWFGFFYINHHGGTKSQSMLTLANKLWQRYWQNYQPALAHENMPSPALCPVRALKFYVEVTASWQVTGQLFVYFGEHHKGVPLSKDKLLKLSDWANILERR